jgi:hypothetical protein
MALNRAACERRVYSLATLLTGDPVAAVGVLEAVERSQPELRAIAAARLDRLTILRCREATAGPLPTAVLPADAAGAIAGLAAQPREAWILIRAYGLPLRETARSMDCSVTATKVHIELADRRMASVLDGQGIAAAIDALRAYSRSLQLPEHYAINRERRRRNGRVLTLIGLILLVVLLMVIVDWLSPG